LPAPGAGSPLALPKAFACWPCKGRPRHSPPLRPPRTLTPPHTTHPHKTKSARAQEAGALAAPGAVRTNESPWPNPAATPPRNTRSTPLIGHACWHCRRPPTPPTACRRCARCLLSVASEWRARALTTGPLAWRLPGWPHCLYPRDMPPMPFRISHPFHRQPRPTSAVLLAGCRRQATPLELARYSACPRAHQNMGAGRAPSGAHVFLADIPSSACSSPAARPTTLSARGVDEEGRILAGPTRVAGRPRAAGPTRPLGCTQRSHPGSGSKFFTAPWRAARGRARQEGWGRPAARPAAICACTCSWTGG
jgi:hypothetical protein